MKKIFIMTVAALCMGIAVTSCGDDEPERPTPNNYGGGGGGNGNGGNNNGGNNSSSNIIPTCSKLIASIWGEPAKWNNGYFFNYDTDKSLLEFGRTRYSGNPENPCENPLYVWANNKFERASLSSETNTITNINVDSRGLITSFTDTYTDLDTDWDGSEYVDESCTNQYSATYTGNQLTKLVNNYNGFETNNDGTRDNYWGSEEYNITWKDGKIDEITVTEVENYEGESNNYLYTYKLYYDFAPLNPLKQYTFSLTKLIDYDHGLTLLGLFGEGPTQLPTRVDQYYNYKYSQSNHYSYTQNADGSISTEKTTVSYDNGYSYDEDTYTFTYK